MKTQEWRALLGIRNPIALVRFLLLGLVGCLGIVIVVRWSGNDPRYEQAGSLKIGSEIPGVRLLVMKRKTRLFGFSEPQLSGLQDERVVSSNSYALVLQTKLRTLNDLKGLVSIKTKDAALRYVRLQTSPYLIGLWQTDVLDRTSFEVVDNSKKLDSIYNYGYTTKEGDRVEGATKQGVQISGFYGEVSSADFRVHGFTQPQVQQVQGEFEIKRWLILFRSALFRDGTRILVDGGDELQFVKETVKQDGEYHRYVVTSVSPSPPSPGNVCWNTAIVAGRPTIDN